MEKYTPLNPLSRGDFGFQEQLNFLFEWYISFPWKIPQKETIQIKKVASSSGEEE